VRALLLSDRAVPVPDGSAVEKMMAHQFKQPTPLAELAPNAPKELIAVVEKLWKGNRRPVPRGGRNDGGAASAGRPADGRLPHRPVGGAGRRRGGADADAAAANAKCGRDPGAHGSGFHAPPVVLPSIGGAPAVPVAVAAAGAGADTPLDAHGNAVPRDVPPVPARAPTPTRAPAPCARLDPSSRPVPAPSKARRRTWSNRPNTCRKPILARSASSPWARPSRSSALGGAHADEVRRIPVSGWRKPVESSSGQRLSEDATGSRQPAGFAMPTHFSKNDRPTLDEKKESSLAIDRAAKPGK